MTTRKRNDTWPAIAFTPTGADAADLIAELDGSSTATVIVKGTVQTITSAQLTAGFVSLDDVAGQLDPSVKVEIAGTLDDATGVVTWTPLAADVDSEGYWLVEIEYDLDGDGARLFTAPTDGYWPMRIGEDLNDA